MRRRRKKEKTRKDHSGTRMNESHIHLIVCLPLSSSQPCREAGTLWISNSTQLQQRQLCTKALSHQEKPITNAPFHPFNQSVSQMNKRPCVSSKCKCSHPSPVKTNPATFSLSLPGLRLRHNRIRQNLTAI